MTLFVLITSMYFYSPFFCYLVELELFKMDSFVDKNQSVLVVWKSMVSESAIKDGLQLIKSKTGDTGSVSMENVERLSLGEYIWHQLTSCV